MKALYKSPLATCEALNKAAYNLCAAAPNCTHAESLCSMTHAEYTARSATLLYEQKPGNSIRAVCPVNNILLLSIAVIM